MALFWTDSIVLYCADVPASRQWWISVFDCAEEEMPDCDDPLPSDVALRLPGQPEPAIYLKSRPESRHAGLPEPEERAILFTGSVRKAHERLRSRGVAAGPIETGGGLEFFSIRDLDGNEIEICTDL